GYSLPYTAPKEFTTAPAEPPPTNIQPSANTLPATNVGETTAVLNGAVVPGTTGGLNVGSTYHFEWGEGTGAAALTKSTPDQSLTASDQTQSVSATLTGLRTNVTHSYRVVVIRNGQRFASDIVQFTPKPLPSCTDGATYQTGLKI